MKRKAPVTPRSLTSAWAMRLQRTSDDVLNAVIGSVNVNLEGEGDIYIHIVTSQ